MSLILRFSYLGTNRASAALSSTMVTVHRGFVPAWVQAPVHPSNLVDDDGVAVRVTFAYLLKFFVHVLPQEIPKGLLVTVPLPVSETESD